MAKKKMDKTKIIKIVVGVLVAVAGYAGYTVSEDLLAQVAEWAGSLEAALTPEETPAE